AARLRHGGGGARPYVVRRRAPARVDRARDPPRSSDPHSRRGDEQRRHGDRARNPAGARTPRLRADRVRHRAPAFDAAQGVAVVRDRGRAARGARHPCRVAGEVRRKISAVVRAAAAAPVEGRNAMTLVATERAAPTLRLEWRSDGSLWALRGDEERAVAVRRCFPWSEPARYLSLRDSEEEEFAVVRDPADLDARSRAALEMALAVAGFVFEVTRLLEIDEEVEIRQWRGEGRQGPRTCQTRLDGWPRVWSHGGPLLPAIAGELSHLSTA